MQADLTTVLEQQLRDVHLPEQVGLWPLAPGWWLLAALISLIIVLLVWRIRRYLNRNAYRKAARRELENAHTLWTQDNDAGAYLQTANKILKRSALEFSDHEAVANLSGSNWITHLNGLSRRPLQKTTQAALSEHLYQAKVNIDLAGVHAELITWLTTHTHNTSSDKSGREERRSNTLDSSERGRHA